MKDQRLGRMLRLWDLFLARSGFLLGAVRWRFRARSFDIECDYELRRR